MSKKSKKKLPSVNDLKTIQIVYWVHVFDTVPYDHKQIVPYSKEKRNEIVDTIMEAGLNVVLLLSEDTLVIGIDDRAFQQR